MTEHTFFAGGTERWGKDMIHLWGSLNICPHLNHLKLPCHSLKVLHSICKLKVWGNVQEPRSNIAYLLVWTRDNLEAQDYGMSLVWVSPNQVWAPTMEEAVGTLSAYISSGPDWPYALAQLHEGSSNTPLPRDKHLGILPQGKGEGSPYGWISQLEVHQPLSAGPQVIYPVGLNGTNEPVTTTLPEQLHSSASIITYEHPYMRIDIPPPPLEELGHPTSLVDEANTITVTNSPETPQKPRISMATEVDNLLTQVMADGSSCKPEHSPTGEAVTVEAVTSLPHKSEDSPHWLILHCKPVWRRWRLLSSVSLPMSPLSLLPTAAAVPVHQ